MKKKILGILILASVLAVCTLPSRAEKKVSEAEVMIYCEEIGNMYHICPELLFAIAERESTLNPNAVNGSCKGIMQVSDRWHKDRMKRLGVDDLFDAYGCILVATDYLAELFDDFEDVAIVLGIYHGEKDVISRTENCEFSSYVNGILNRAMELEERR